MLGNKLSAPSIARVSTPIMLPGFALGENTNKNNAAFIPQTHFINHFQRQLGISKTIRIQSGETENSSPTALSDVYLSSPLFVHMPTLALWKHWAPCRIHTVSHAYNHSLGFNTKVGISNCFNNSKSYDSLARGYYYAACLIKALRDEGTVPGSNGLVSVHIK